MGWPSVLAQFLNGLAGASSLFLLAAGLSLIFGVTRIVNFAHGSLYMLGMYAAAWLAGLVGFWPAVPLAAVGVGLVGLAIETLLLRNIYKAPELLQLLATFALVLVIGDAALWLWGPEDLLGPRAPGFRGAVEIAGVPFPAYDLLLIVVGPAVLGVLFVLIKRTRFGILLRAATEDREMAGALGINEKLLFTGVFALGALLAGLGGALAIPREPASLGVDLAAISDAFVVVVVGGLGSIPGAFLAALAIAEVKAFAVGLGFSKATLVIEFVVMALVLVIRPWGLLGKPIPHARPHGAAAAPLPKLTPRALAMWAGVAMVLAVLPLLTDGYALLLLGDIFVFALFAMSLHFLVGPGGMYSFGHAAFFGIGAYVAAFFFLKKIFPMELALLAGPLGAALAALVFGWFTVRLSGVYAAMLTLAFAQIAWSAAFQWDAVTGGSNGLIGVWPSAWLSSRTAYYWMTLVLCFLAVGFLVKIFNSRFGYTLRAARDSPLRAEASGIDVRRTQWTAFTLAGLAAGLAGALYAFSKGSISPEILGIPRSVDGLVMVLLGGVQSLTGPIWGAALFTWLQDAAARNVEYWRAAVGAAILALILLRRAR